MAPAIGIFELKDIGPVTELTIPVSPGITVIYSENEGGKTTTIQAVRGHLGADVALAPRDGCEKGMIRGFGSTYTIASRVSRAGKSEVDSTEAAIGLDDIIDPKSTEPKTALKRRVKALAVLSGVTLSPDDFLGALGGVTLSPEQLAEVREAKGDPVEVADKIRGIINKAAKALEDAANDKKSQAKALRESRQWTGKKPTKTLEEAETAVQEAAAEKAKLDQAKETHRIAAEAVKTAQAELGALSTAEAEKKQIDAEFAEAEAAETKAAADLAALRAKLKDLEVEVAKADKDHNGKAVDRANYARAAESAGKRVGAIKEAETRASAKIPQPPSEIDYEAAQAAYTDAMAERDAIKHTAEEAAAMAKILAVAGEGEKATAAAETMRAAAGRVDAVLQTVVASDLLSFQDGDLVVTRDGKTESFGRLSKGAMYGIVAEIAVKAAARLGKPAILPLSQESWEGMDQKKSKALYDACIEHGLAIITAEWKAATPEHPGIYAEAFDPATGKKSKSEKLAEA